MTALRNDGMTKLFPQDWHSCRWRMMTALRNYGMTKLFSQTSILASGARWRDCGTTRYGQECWSVRVRNAVIPLFRFNSPRARMPARQGSLCRHCRQFRPHFSQEPAFLQVARDYGIARLRDCGIAGTTRYGQECWSVRVRNAVIPLFRFNSPRARMPARQGALCRHSGIPAFRQFRPLLSRTSILSRGVG